MRNLLRKPCTSHDDYDALLTLLKSYDLHMRSQSGETLSSAASDAKKQTIAEWLANNTTDTT